MHCTVCGFLQIKDPHWLEEAYSSAIAASDTGLVMRNLAYAERLAAFIYFVLPGHGEGHYLDVAGGYGLLVRLMRDYGFDFYWSDKYCSNLFSRGFEFDTDKGPFSAITAIEVMEHTPDPYGFIKDALSSASCDTFIFSTELYKGSPPGPDDWWYYSLKHGQHISFFREDTLEILSERLGLKYYSLAGLHVFTKNNLPTLRTKFFSKKFTPFLANLATKALTSKCKPDHDYISSLLPD